MGWLRSDDGGHFKVGDEVVGAIANSIGSLDGGCAAIVSHGTAGDGAVYG